jgi:hypothetical protein
MEISCLIFLHFFLLSRPSTDSILSLSLLSSGYIQIRKLFIKSSEMIKFTSVTRQNLLNKCLDSTSIGATEPVLEVIVRYLHKIIYFVMGLNTKSANPSYFSWFVFSSVFCFLLSLSLSVFLYHSLSHSCLISI